MLYMLQETFCKTHDVIESHKEVGQKYKFKKRNILCKTSEMTKK
jgi:hypothetical protein